MYECIFFKTLIFVEGLRIFVKLPLFSERFVFLSIKYVVTEMCFTKKI